MSQNLNNGDCPLLTKNNLDANKGNASKKDETEGGNINLASNLEYWMTQLPTELRSLPIIYLAIPGSHDSFTSNITANSEVAPDAEPVLQNLSFFICIRYFMANWSKTQALDVNEQLANGIRYFDLRLATKKDESNLYFVHGLYSIQVQLVLDDIAQFLDSHPDEIVILDCQHFYAFTKETHFKLMSMLENTFGNKLLPYMECMDYLTLDFMTKIYKYQVIVIYRNDSAINDFLLWPSAFFPNPWADTDSKNNLFQALDDGLKSRCSSIGFISQCILTPTFGYILRYLYSTLKQTCAVDLQKQRTEWILNQAPGPDGKLNIIIADYAHMSDNLFTKTVINLNSKLLTNNKMPQYPILTVVTEIKR